MLEKVRLYIEQQQLFTADDKLLLAISGGGDSMAMAEILINLGYTVIICHCNFQLRPIEADIEEEFVKKQFKDKAPVFTKSFNTVDYAKEQGISIEMSARDLRYQWFNEISQQTGSKYICTAHHCNDSVETVFLNMLRGTGIAGLTGIKPIRDNIRRPLLSCTSEEISNYLTKKGLPFCTDSSNLESDYKRNKIRNLAFPIFEEINPSFIHSMKQNIERIKSVENVYARYIENLKSKLFHREENYIEINRKLLFSEVPDENIMFDIFSEFNFTYDTINQIFNQPEKETGKHFASNSHILTYIKDSIRIDLLAKISRKRIPPINRQTLSNEFYSSELVDRNELDFKQTDAIYLDSKKLRFPLQFRTWQQGDKVILWGMKGKSKKVSDILNDYKLHGPEKINKQILVSENEIIWVTANRINEKYAITEQTEQIVKITFRQKF